MNQTKQLVALLSFFISVAILGYVLFLPPERPLAEVRTEQEQLAGAQLYQTNCASCHGQIGLAEECFRDGAGGRIGCIGRPLNYAPLLCGDPSERLQAVSWNDNLSSYLNAMTTIGRSENGMPAYGQQYGGVLTEQEIMLISQYIMGWQTDELCAEAP